MLFVVVNGPPGSGKSTLATRLAIELDWPLIAKDDIKEALGDALDVGGQEWTRGGSRRGGISASVALILLAASSCTSSSE